MSQTQSIAAVIHRHVERVSAARRLPNPMPPPMASALRSMVTAAECAALAGVEAQDFDALLGVVRRAYTEKLAAGVGQ